MLDVQSLMKYLLEGLAVAAAAYYIPQRTANLKEIVMIALTAAAVFAILDQFAPAVSDGARQGAGFGIGINITNGLEGFSDDESEAAAEIPPVEAPAAGQPVESESNEASEECNEVQPYSDDLEPYSSVL
jgi:hypothetical protein